jgi:hypothetical protein
MRKNYKRYICLAITLAVCILIGFQIGSSNSRKSEEKSEEEIMMGNIYKELYDVNHLLSYFKENTDSFTYEEYSKLMKEANDLIVTLDIAAELLYSKNEVPFHLLSDSLDISILMFEGLNYKNRFISNDFFDDGIINEDEQRYIMELSEDIKTIVDNYDNNKEHDYDSSAFEDAFKPFIAKYTIGDELLDLKVNN